MLRRFAKTAPIEIVELARNRLVATTDPSDDGIRIWRDDGSGNQVAEIEASGINTARGALAETMAAFLHYDTDDGRRAALVEPFLKRLAGDPAIPVRVCVAQLLLTAMRNARESATNAYWELLDSDDVVLAANRVVRVLVFLGNDDRDGERAAVLTVLDRMLASQRPAVRELGGQLASFAALEWNDPGRLDAILAGQDSAARKGAAGLAASELTRTTSRQSAAAILQTLADDADPQVRGEIANAAAELRGHELRPYTELLVLLIRSQAFSDAVSQLVITLNQAPDRVDGLAVAFTDRFVEVLGTDAADIRTGAAGDVQEVATLLIRGIAQASRPADRAVLLDALDRLLLTGGYGADDVVVGAER
jgi:hypothetical protein